MSIRRPILNAILIAVILAAAGASFVVWRQQQRAAVVSAGLPKIPDLSRWPVSFSNEVWKATIAARETNNPVEPLARLAGLYLVNAYAAQAKPPLMVLRQLEPANARWAYLLADAHVRLGETNAAVGAFQETVKLDPGYPLAWIRLGLLRTQLGDVKAAQECYQRAAAVAPQDVRAAYLLLTFETRNINGSDVRPGLTELAQVHPEIKQIHLLLADLDTAAGDSDGAARENRLAGATDRNLTTEDPWIDNLSRFCFDADHLRVLSSQAFYEGRFDAAENLLNRGIQLAPADPLMWDALYSIYETTGRPVQAFEALQRGMTKCPDDVNLRVQLSRLLCTQHRPEDAVALLQQALQRWPASAPLHAALGFALSTAGRNEPAVAELREAIRLDFTLVDAHFNLGVGLLALGQRAEARAAVEQALAMRPDYIDAMVLLSVVEMEQNDFAAAGPTVTRLYTLRSQDPRARSLFARLQLFKGAEAEHGGQFAEAEKFYQDGLNATPQYTPLLRAKGMLAGRQSHFPEAIEAFQQYVQLEPRNPIACLLLGRALQGAGRGEESRAVLERGLPLAQAAGDPRLVEEFQRALHH